MEERTGLITMKGQPLTLLGHEATVGETSPVVTLIANDMSTVSLDELRGQILILASVPSLDTSVCDMETRRFNQEATQLSNEIRILTISMDLPFAQKRWCGAAGVDRVQTLSDYRDAAFGNAYGVLIKELHLLARAVFVIDRAGIIRYVQIVPEQASEPDYAAALDAARALI